MAKGTAEQTTEETPAAPATTLPHRALPPMPRGGRDALRTTDVIDDAFFHDLAGLFLARIRSPRELAYRLGVSTQTISRAVNDPRFQAIYAVRRNEHVERLDEFILDEKMETDERLEALRTRAVTTAAEIMEEIRDRVKRKGYAKAAEMKVGIEAAIAMMDRAPGGRGAVSKQTFVFAPTLAHAKVIGDAAREAGLDMATVLDAEFTVEEPTPDSESPDA